MKAIDAQLELREELVNCITHALGILFGLISIPILVFNATSRGDNNIAAGAGIYGLSFLMVFTFSTLFHSKRQGRMRNIFKKLDHISIYWFIAGTYTPFIIIFVNNQFGITLLVVLWGLTILGTIFKTFLTGKFDLLSTIIYLIMGWLLLAGADEFFANMPTHVVSLIICGAGLYTLGVVFYIWRLFAYHHAVWHLLVLSAAICHYSAIAIAI